MSWLLRFVIVVCAGAVVDRLLGDDEPETKPETKPTPPEPPT